MDLEPVITSVVERDGLELVEVSFGMESGRRVLRVTVERPDGGLDLDAIATESERISRRLDLEGFEPGPYSLEVSSPGLERPLRPDRPQDFTRRVGARVKVRVAPPGRTAETMTGTIAAADEHGVTIAGESGERTVAYAEITKARTVFDWSDAKRKSDEAREGVSR
jgi:ribosome maturation factor RimP